MTSGKPRTGPSGHSHSFGWMLRRIIVLAALFLGLVAASDLAQANQGPIVIQHSAQATTTIDLNEQRRITVSLNRNPQGTFIAAVRLGCEPCDRIIRVGRPGGPFGRATYLVFNPNNWMGQDIVVKGVGTGTATLMHSQIPWPKPYFDRLTTVHVRRTNQVGDIMIMDTMEHPFKLVHNPDNVYAPWDIAFGSSAHVTYQVKVIGAVCPATVEIRGRPRWRTGEHPEYSNRIQIAAGNAPPPQIKDRRGAPEISATLTFNNDGTCNDAQFVTIYGVPNYNHSPQYSAYVSLTHTLIQKNNNTVNEAGPILKAYAHRRTRYPILGGVPSFDNATVVKQTRSFELPRRSPTTINLANSVGPSEHAGRAISPLNSYNVQRFFLTLNPPNTSGTQAWTEFCVYIDGVEKSMNDMGEFHLPNTGTLKTPLAEVTLLPIEFKYYTNTPEAIEFHRHADRARVNTDYGYPFELQRYTDVVNPNGGCRPVASDDGGSWETVYSGGSASLANVPNPATWQKSANAFILPQSQWGQYINVRMRAVYGLPTGLTGIRHNVNIQSGATNGQSYMYRNPEGAIFVYFTLEEMHDTKSLGHFIVHYLTE